VKSPFKFQPVGKLSFYWKFASTNIKHGAGNPPFGEGKFRGRMEIWSTYATHDILCWILAALENSNDLPSAHCNF